MGLVVLLLAGCPKPPANVLQVGSIFSQTGTLAAVGADHARVAQMAIDEINLAGGVLGRSLQLVNRDDKTDPTAGAEAARQLVELGVPVVLGALASQVTLEASKVLSAASVVQISGASTSPAITTTADNGFLFRTCASDLLQGKLLAQRARARNHARVAVIHLPGAYGQGLADVFQSELERSGGMVTAKREYVEMQTSYVALLTDILADNPEAVVLVAYPEDGAQIIRDYIAQFSGRVGFWYFPDALADDGFVGLVQASNFTFQHEGTGPAAPTQDYIDKYSSRFGTPPNPGTFAHNVYDAVYLAALAITAADRAEGPAIKAALPGVSSGGTKLRAAMYAEAVGALKAGMDVDYDGVSGPVDFDANGDVVAPYGIWKVMGGKVTFIEPIVEP
jgi:branched-chain amino acid transport system substrate-binding protein